MQRYLVLAGPMASGGPCMPHTLHTLSYGPDTHIHTLNCLLDTHKSTESTITTTVAVGELHTLLLANSNIEN